MIHSLSAGNDPHTTSPLHVPQVEFKCILFVPGDATGLYEDYNNRKAGMKLYVRKVLIQEDFEDLLPR
jgi:heat shock protein 90kDa beta